MKLLLFIPIYGRQPIVEMCFEGVERLKKHWPCDIEVITIVSEKWAKQASIERGYHYVEAENKPLGRKFNKGLEGALKLEWDYLMRMDSDTLINNKLWRIYEPYFNEGMDLFGLDKCWFYEMETGKVRLVDYQLSMICAGRCHSRKSIDKFVKSNNKVQVLEAIAGPFGNYCKDDRTYLPGFKAMQMQEAGQVSIISTGHTKLWDDDLNKCLGNDAYMRLVQYGCSNQILSPVDNPYIVDLKTDDNIWSFNDMQHWVEQPTYLLQEQFKEIRELPELV